MVKLTHLPQVLHIYMICVGELGHYILVQVMACRLFGAKPLPESMVSLSIGP